MVVVDSGVWIDLFTGRENGATAALERLLEEGQTHLVLPDLVVFEVLRGFRSEGDLRVARSLFNALQIDTVGGADLAHSAADQYRRLRRLGLTIRNGIDSLVATFCIERGFALLHRDRDYDAYVEHLGLQAWPHLDS
ncbi:PIN domain-containing protein [Roseateles asaccharophilus]|uniref:Ribonuclease VapC n=1 Tax=Roseateles asaccharophilus TaxID=582607 RepID=A0ABU2A635_9BURK|nr:PIN domain-containing protein [Roseateles asaccharophilus]MDR7332661.1 putative nucleic acid-binding protein [Roseateles asaccharophilus]